VLQGKIGSASSFSKEEGECWRLKSSPCNNN
jgi:hypothetical protein